MLEKLDKRLEKLYSDMKTYINLEAKHKKMSPFKYAISWRVALELSKEDGVQETIDLINYFLKNEGKDNPKRIIVSNSGKLDEDRFYNRYAKECIDRVDETCRVVNMPPKYSDYKILYDGEKEYVLCVVKEKIKILK